MIKILQLSLGDYKKMLDKKRSIMSKGWLIIGIVIILTGLYQIIITNSLNTINNNTSLETLFLTITSIIIILIGTIMTIEWVRFSKFLKEYAKE